MAETMIVPQLGNSVESVVLLEWKVDVGSPVSEGDVVCEVETDKATMDVESTVSGTLLKHLADPGDELPVRAPLLVVGAPGEEVGDVAPSGSAGGSSPSEPGADVASQPTARAASTPIAAVRPASGTPGSAVSPRARLRAAEGNVDTTRIAGTGPAGRVIERDVLAHQRPATAAARAAGTTGYAGDAGGIGERVTVSDLLGGEPPTAGAVAAPAGAAVESYETVRVAGVRKVIAERMLASLQQTAQLTLHASADARALQHLRARIKADGGPLGLGGVNINDMVMYAVARTLGSYPDVNAHFLDTEIRRFGGVDLGFAVDTPRGLLVPTLQRADLRSLGGLSRASKALATRAIEGKAGPEDLAPATFTVTNLGAFGVERFTPVLNPPQVAILGVGSIGLKPIAGDGPAGVAHVPHIGLSLTIDHRAVDGAPAARFLKALSERIAAIDLLLAR